MATKNLARTAIEGGRCGHYKMEVAARAAEERAATRAFLQRVAHDDEDAEALVDPRRRPVRACFADKLAPVHRYLEANCGRPWSKVREDLFARFDIRTTPGRHILFDHVLREVEQDRRWSPRFRIDDHGMLRKAPRRQYPRRAWFDERPVFEWLGDRRITRAGDRFMWWVPTKRVQRKLFGQTDVRWRATGLLDENDERYLSSLPEALRERVLARHANAHA
jgi:hypothetical protein